MLIFFLCLTLAFYLWTKGAILNKGSESYRIVIVINEISILLLNLIKKFKLLFILLIKDLAKGLSRQLKGKKENKLDSFKNTKAGLVIISECNYHEKIEDIYKKFEYVTLDEKEDKVT
tara:strand:+ start:221 stop:574 length:354 start_codon:yes stop_codon:yes gene_type:complete